VNCESLSRETTGKPDAGNPHVRFEEGEQWQSKDESCSLLY